MTNKLPLMAGCGVVPPRQCECGCDYTCLTLTKVQDIERRASYDPATGVLNLPPAIVARRQQAALGIYLSPWTWQPIVGLERIVIDSTGGLMTPASPDDRIVIPRDGHFDLAVHVAVDSDTEGVVYLRMVVRGIGGFTRTVSAPLVPGVGAGVDAESQASPRSKGDTVQVEVMVTCASGAVVDTVSVAAGYVEGS